MISYDVKWTPEFKKISDRLFEELKKRPLNNVSKELKIESTPNSKGFSVYFKMWQRLVKGNERQ